MLEYLKDLCLLDGTSGREDKVREYIISKIKAKSDEFDIPFELISKLIIEIEKNNLDNATNYLSIAKYIDENDFRYYYYQGLVFKNKGLPADAKRSFRKSLKLNPNYTPAKEELSI